MKFLKASIITLLCTAAMTFAACGGENDNAANNNAGKTDTGNVDAGNTGNTDTGNADTGNADTGYADSAEALAARQFGKDINNALEQHYCHIVMTCPEVSEYLLQSVSRYVDVEGCIASGSYQEPGDSAEAEIAAINANRLGFNASKAAECLEAIKTASTTCDLNMFFYDHVEVANPCYDVFEGRQAKSAECLHSQECLSGVCVNPKYYNDDVCELGTCADAFPAINVVGEGEDCTNDTCDKNLYCDRQEQETDICRAIQTVNKGEDCDEYNGKICAENLTCDEVCIDKPTIGNKDDVCDSDTKFCKHGLTCLNLTGGDTFTCVPHSAKNAPCNENFNCQPGLWCDVETQDSPGKCVGTLELGKPCYNSEACGSDAFCDDVGSVATCLARGTEPVCAI